MNEIVKVGNESVPVIEWKGQRVITTALLAEVYETDENNVKNNFNRNKDNFVEGKHYFCLKGDDLRDFKRYVTQSDLPLDDSLKFASHLYLWTRRGANRHCKILDTDKAWEQFDILEESYYKKMTALERLQLQQEALLEVNEKVDNVESRVTRLENDVPLYGSEADNFSRAVKRKGVDVLGGKHSNAYKDSKLRMEVYTDIYNQVKREYGLYDNEGKFVTYKALKRKYYQDALKMVEEYKPPKYLEEKIRDYNAQLSIDEERPT